MLTMFANATIGQSQSQRDFRIYLDRVNLMYTLPSGFNEADSCQESLFYYTKPYSENKYLYPLNTKLYYRDSTICIGFNITRLQLKNDSNAVLKAMFPGRTENTNYTLSIRHKADTVNNKVVYYSSKESNRFFNADISGTYWFYMQIPFEGRYHYCRIVFMHKKNIGDAEIYYFYDDENSRKKVDRLVKNAYEMLRFK